MKILIYAGHPAQYLFFRKCLQKLNENGHQTITLIKSKDVLEELVRSDTPNYLNILSEGRKNNKFGILIGLLKRIYRLGRIVRKEKPDLLIGTDPSLAQTGKLLGVPCITTLEDDYDVIPALAKSTYPFSCIILTPKVCKVGKYTYKKIGYDGYMKLAYLHPNNFEPDLAKVRAIIPEGNYYLLRLSGLSAHHDFSIKGISESLLDQIIETLAKKGKVFISSENPLPEKYKQHNLDISVSDIHHFLYYAEILIGDSQSMAVEASVLGTPNIRISSFIGRINVLEELENKYDLSYGFKPESEKEVLQKLNELLSYKDLQNEFRIRKNKMLEDKIDVTAFLTWFIEEYPSSAEIIRKNPDFQYRFR